ncbi:hypothetical protein DFJ73DRAFT_805795 [Zopfochytrium polystomum]|nr:hypothetical protein DFJ73DRAFT_805795 [Zopfochytrium polystomum]
MEVSSFFFFFSFSFMFWPLPLGLTRMNARQQKRTRPAQTQAACAAAGVEYVEADPLDTGRAWGAVERMAERIVDSFRSSS